MEDRLFGEAVETRTTPVVNPGADLLRAFKVAEVQVEEPEVVEPEVVRVESLPTESPQVGWKGPRERFSAVDASRGGLHLLQAREAKQLRASA